MIDVVLLLAAGVVGGLTGSIAGLASVATYPALLAVGLPPVTANVTNTVALVFNGIGSVWGSGPELAGRRAWIIRIVPFAALGGAAGAVLLLAFLLNIGHANLASANAAKNLTMGVANAVAAAIFAVLAPVQWAAVLPLGVGCLLGSRLGPVVVRHAPAAPLRFVIAVSGLALAVVLGADTYG